GLAVAGDNQAAAVHHRIPAHSEVFSVERCGGDKSGSCLWTFVDAVLPPRSLPGAEKVHVQGERLRDAANRHLAVNFGIGWTEELDALRCEGDFRVMLDIEKIRRLQMCVALRFAAPQSGRVDHGSHL